MAAEVVSCALLSVCTSEDDGVRVQLFNERPQEPYCGADDDLGAVMDLRRLATGHLS